MRNFSYDRRRYAVVERNEEIHLVYHEFGRHIGNRLVVVANREFCNNIVFADFALTVTRIAHAHFFGQLTLDKRAVCLSVPINRDGREKYVFDFRFVYCERRTQNEILATFLFDRCGDGIYARCDLHVLHVVRHYCALGQIFNDYRVRLGVVNARKIVENNALYIV